MRQLKLHKTNSELTINKIHPKLFSKIIGEPMCEQRVGERVPLREPRISLVRRRHFEFFKNLKLMNLNKNLNKIGDMQNA